MHQLSRDVPVDPEDGLGPGDIMALASSVGGGVRGAAFGLHGAKGRVSDVITDRLDMKEEPPTGPPERFR